MLQDRARDHQSRATPSDRLGHQQFGDLWVRLVLKEEAVTAKPPRDRLGERGAEVHVAGTIALALSKMIEQRAHHITGLMADVCQVTWFVIGPPMQHLRTFAPTDERIGIKLSGLVRLQDRQAPLVLEFEAILPNMLQQEAEIGRQ